MEKLENSSFYYFPPWKKQYIVSGTEIDNGKSSNHIYQPYNNLVKIVWDIWLNYKFFRKIFSIKLIKLPKLFHQIIIELGLTEYTFQVNIGTPGSEQKITIIASSPSGIVLFIKVGNSLVSSKLIQNEANILNKLPKEFNIPLLRRFYVGKDFTYLVTNVIIGKKINSVNLNKNILNYIIQISKYDQQKTNNIIYCLSHGDFCPWNIIVDDNNTIYAIDWELASLKPMGYDLITYIFRTNFLLNNRTSFEHTLKINQEYIEEYFKYFSISNYKDYIKINAKIQIEYVRGKNLKSLTQKWQWLFNYY